VDSPRDYLADAARDRPAEVGAASGALSRTFAELDRDATLVTSALAGSPNPRVGVCLPNSVAWPAVLAGIWRAGGEAVLFPAATPTPALLRDLGRERLGTLVASPERVAELAPPWGGQLIEMGNGAVATRRGVGVGEEVEARRPGTMLFTSGTTSAPKPVELSYASLRTVVEATLAQMGARPGAGDAQPAGSASRTASLIVFPLYHISGLFQLVMATARQAPAVILDRFTVEAFLDALAGWKVRQVVLNPTMLKALVQTSDPRADELVGRLRLIRSGTAALDSRTRDAFAARFGVLVLQGYGSTETGGEIAGWTPGDVREFGVTKATSVGRPRPCVAIAVRDDDGRDVGPGVVGRLAVRVPWLFDDWRDIGDLGSLDEDGFLHIAGRADDVINCGGFMIQPAVVEEAIAGCSGVDECAVVGEPDERLGEVPVAYVVLRPGHTCEAVEAAVAATELLPYQRPRQVRVVDRLPRNALGKLVRADLNAVSSNDGGN
jgi:acyl-CoA synthetase (AMP-forming)/AMP-acid ligase II